MKTYHECIPCFLKQTIRSLNTVESDHHEVIIKEVLHKLGDMDLSLSPPEIVYELSSLIKKHTGNIDHYADEKKKSNKYIMGMYKNLSKIIESSNDPFDTAMRLAISGNIIDFGAKHDFSDEMIHAQIDKVLISKEICSDLLKK